MEFLHWSSLIFEAFVSRRKDSLLWTSQLGTLSTVSSELDQIKTRLIWSRADSQVITATHVRLICQPLACLKTLEIYPNVASLLPDDEHKRQTVNFLVPNFELQTMNWRSSNSEEFASMSTASVHHEHNDSDELRSNLVADRPVSHAIRLTGYLRQPSVFTFLFTSWVRSPDSGVLAARTGRRELFKLFKLN